MISKDKLNRFAIKSEVFVQSDQGREIMLAEMRAAEPADPDIYALAGSAIRDWPGDWKIDAVRAEPVCPVAFGGAPQSGSEYWRFVDEIIAEAAKAGIGGFEWLREAPNGWLPLLEAAISGLVTLLGQRQSPDDAVLITQIKEKFGTLRFYIKPVGGASFCAGVAQIATWTELSSQNRCMVTGMRGTRRGSSWVMTLSDEADCLRRTDHDKFLERLHPSRP